MSSRLSGAASNLSLTLPAISSFLLGAKSNYSSARPCMLDLLSRLQDINIHVITLPSNIFVRSHNQLSKYTPLFPLIISFRKRCRFQVQLAGIKCRAHARFSCCDATSMFDVHVCLLCAVWWQFKCEDDIGESGILYTCYHHLSDHIYIRTDLSCVFCYKNSSNCLFVWWCRQLLSSFSRRSSHWTLCCTMPRWTPLCWQPR